MPRKTGPRIGVNMCELAWNDAVCVVGFKLDYTRAIHDAGGVPYPMDPWMLKDAPDLCDAFLGTGGWDWHPGLYGERTGPETRAEFPWDALELDAIGRMDAEGFPMLLTCRWMQGWNIARGGKLNQHVLRHSPQYGGTGFHQVRVEPGCRLHEALGLEGESQEACLVDTVARHHQAIRRDALGDGLRPVAWCADDEVIEALEHPDQPHTLGVQWHVERPFFMSPAGIPLLRRWISSLPD